ncbi:MAG: hypothetical protein ACPGSD_07395 [Flavobacteriales bacterium]
MKYFTVNTPKLFYFSSLPLSFGDESFIAKYTNPAKKWPIITIAAK